MIQAESRLKVADNTGARKVLCIKVLGGSKRRYARVGDVMVVTVEEALPTGAVQPGDVVGAAVVRTTKDVRRVAGSYPTIDDNPDVLHDSQHNHGGTLIFHRCAHATRDHTSMQHVGIAPKDRPRTQT
mgnify:CR=1 FL=1